MGNSAEESSEDCVEQRMTVAVDVGQVGRTAKYNRRMKADRKASEGLSIRVRINGRMRGNGIVVVSRTIQGNSYCRGTRDSARDCCAMEACRADDVKRNAKAMEENRAKLMSVGNGGCLYLA
jgi:hypothetical protein